MIRRLCALGALFAVASAFQSATAAPAHSTVLVASMPVSYSDLDTGSQAGQAALKARLTAAANQVCGGSPVFNAQYRVAPKYVRADFQRCSANAQQNAITTLAQRGIVIADAR